MAADREGGSHRLPNELMRPKIRISLFGKFTARHDALPLLDGIPQKVQELLAYLILHRDRAHTRETLAELLWDEYETPHARKYLRQALWQLKAGTPASSPFRRLVRQEPGWIKIALDGVWVDVIEFEAAFRAIRGSSLNEATARRAIRAVGLHRGLLLEGHHPSWCQHDRERFREMYLTLLDRIVCHCDEGGDYEAGVHFGALALQCDRARERTHRRLMSLQFRAGDRTGALRQYERCVAALREELDVEPSRETLVLYEQLRADNLRRAPR